MKVIVVLFQFSDLREVEWVYNVGVILNLYLVFFNIGYSLASLKNLRINKARIQSPQYKLGNALVLIFLGYGLVLILRRVLTEFLIPELSLIDNYLYLIAAVMLYWISYKLVDEPQLLTSRRKYIHSKLSDTDIKSLGARLQSYFNSTKAFTNQDFNLDKISKDLAIPKHQLSQVIGEYFGVSFYDLVNELRVNEVKNCLLSNKYKHLSITGIAMECGFQSKSAFNNAFKRFTSKTPYQFQKEGP